MGDSVEQYRAAIGMFNNHKRKTTSFPILSDDTYQEILLTNFRCTYLVLSLSVFQSLNIGIDIVFLLFVLQYILIIGNVEQNPGPGHSYESNAPSLDHETCLSVCNINIRSVRNKIEFLQNFCDEFDIVTVVESHVSPNVKDDEIELESFSKRIFRKDRNNSGGGVIIYTKDDLLVMRKEEFENPFDETIWLEIRGRGLNFLLCTAYRSDFSDDNFWTRLSHSVENGVQSGNIILTGDMNSDLFKQTNNKLVDIMNLFNLKSVTDKPTRVTNHSSTLLDPIIINDELNCIYSDVLEVPPEISDHFAAVAFFECSKPIYKSFSREIWLYERTDKEKFTDLLNSTDWNSLLSDLDDVDEMCHTFTSKFLQIARQCIPTKTIIVRKDDKPWFTSELRREIRIRDRLRRKALKSKRENDITKYKRQRNKVNNLKKIAKENFENNIDNIILENAPNSKTYWKIMKMLIKSSKGSSCIPPLKNSTRDEDLDDIVFNDDDKCNLLNKYFALISTLDEEDAIPGDIGLKTDEKLQDISINLDEIIDVIKILEPNKASGPDIISHRMLKICPQGVAEPLRIIFNKSLSQCKFPSAWKIAHVIAIFKKGDTSLPSNYRPISLISCVGKIMERVIYKYVYNHLQTHKLLYQYQSGFLPKNSTVHQLLEIYDTILNALEKREFSCFVFCDFSKAFDKVWHKGLLSKLKSYGINGNLHQWFESYLSDRQQKVVINNSSSNFLKVSAGVPQGSVLGPLLFIIYINDIAENLISLTRLFADDTSFSSSGCDELQIQSVINHDLNALSEWSRQWLMSFNPEKTEIMLFSNREVPNISFTFNGNDIPITKTHKHLGVTFSDDAKWNTHVENILSSVSKHLNVLRKLKYRLSRSNLEKLYLVYVRPIFEYACEVWDNCGTVYSNRLEQLQLEAARIVTGLPIFTNVNKIYQEVGWESLQERRKRRKLQLFHNIQNNNAPPYLNNLIPPCIQSTTTYPLRNGEDIITPFCRLSITNNSYIPSTIRLWNNLDVSVRRLDSLAKFKSELKKLNTENTVVPKYFTFGPRKLNILLTQFRCSATFLNYDLYKVNIVLNPSCRCGAQREDSFHFFFECPLYSDLRKSLFDGLVWLPECLNIDTELLTAGNSLLTNEQNEDVFKLTFEFIKKSKRFLVT